MWHNVVQTFRRNFNRIHRHGWIQEFEKEGHDAHVHCKTSGRIPLKILILSRNFKVACNAYYLGGSGKILSF